MAWLVALVLSGCGDERTNGDVAEEVASSFCGMLDRCETDSFGTVDECVTLLVQNYCGNHVCGRPNKASPDRVDGCIALIEAVQCDESAPNLCIPGLVYYNCPAVDGTPACDGLLEEGG